MTRPYLPKEKRREMLLDIAAGIVDGQGWGALSMISLAEHANVSRQLVYQHFQSVGELVESTATHMFKDLYVRTQQAVSEYNTDLSETLLLTQQMTFELPPGRAQALWRVIAASHPEDKEIADTGRHFRRVLSELWAPVLRKSLGIPKKQALHVSWMLIMAFWGAHQLVDDKELNRKRAMEMVTWLITRLVEGNQMVANSPPAKGRRKRSRN